MALDQLPSDPQCWLCGDSERRVLRVAHSERVFLVACDLCLLRCVFELTGYDFTKQVGQYDALKVYHEERRRRKAIGHIQKGERYAT